MKKIDKKLPDEFRSSDHGKRSFFVNLCGILTAFVVAFGGLALVQGRLAAEESRLLEESGGMKIPVQAQRMESQTIGEIEVDQAILTQEQLTQAVNRMEGRKDASLHEPWLGQLSMAQAVDAGKEWLEDFLLPRMGIELDEESKEYRVSCFLWAEGEEDTGDSMEEPWLSYWSVDLSCAGIDGVLILNALTGQVMSAYITSSYPVEYWNHEKVNVILADYVDSFGIEPSFAVQGQYNINDRTFRQSCGNGEVSAQISISSIMIVSADTESSSGKYSYVTAGKEIREYVHINIGLTMTDLDS